MRRKGHISEKIETMDNFFDAWLGYSRHKLSRENVKRFEKDLEKNLSKLLTHFVEETWRTSSYRDEVHYGRKRRIISKLPVRDHVMQWATCLQVEDLLCSTYIRRSCSCVKGRGTHDFANLLYWDMFDHTEDTWYFVQLDAHHFFQNILNDLMKERIRTKIKDPKLLRFLDEFIDSYYQGLPLGVKISQILANFFFARFDHDAITLFDIVADHDAVAYWRSRYVTDCLLTCRTAEEANELAKGVEYLNAKFDNYMKEGIQHYFRFADNIIVTHRDKVFLHIVVEILIMKLAKDYHISVNKNWNVRPVYDGGIDVCGYVFFHDHMLLRKRNKKELCREVAKWRKKGLSPEEIRLKCASRIGFAMHSHSRNLIKSLDVNMAERLGSVIKKKKSNVPFKGMRYDQKRTFSDIVCKIGQNEDEHMIQLIDYTITDSKVDKEVVLMDVDDGHGGKRREQVERPKKCLALRYKVILGIREVDGEEVFIFEQTRPENEDEELKDAEFFSYSGSAVLLEQAQNDFAKEDLPCPTVIKEVKNKFNKNFYKFT